MDVNAIMVASGALGAVGALSAGMLAVASRVFRVDEDPRISDVIGVLPGANCGGCGFPGCPGYAAAVVEGKALPNLCAPGGADLAQRIGAILGVEVAERERLTAVLRCGGKPECCPERFEYRGVPTCKAATLTADGGAKLCPYGCEGLGDCVAACVFDAIHMGPDRLPVIDRDKCTACGQCVKACPKSILSLEPLSAIVTLACSTRLAARDVRRTCSVGCIACKACVRACPYDALTMVGNLPVFDHQKCVRCGLCVDACKPGCMIALGAVDPGVRATAEALQAERKAAAAAAKKAAAPVAPPKAPKPPDVDAPAPDGADPAGSGNV